MKIYTMRIMDYSDIDEVIQSNIISEERKKRIARFHKLEDQVRSVYSELIIRRVLLESYDYKPHEIEFGYNRYGKPHLKGNRSIQFNCSHSGDYIVACFDDKPVGIDVEQIRDVDLRGIAEQFYTERERNYIFDFAQESDRDSSLNRFYDMWTLKESFIKCVGEGLSIPLTNFTIYKDMNHTFKVSSRTLSASEYNLRLFRLERNYAMSVCSKGNSISNEIVSLSQNHLQC